MERVWNGACLMKIARLNVTASTNRDLSATSMIGSINRAYGSGIHIYIYDRNN